MKRFYRPVRASGDTFFEELVSQIEGNTSGIANPSALQEVPESAKCPDVIFGATLLQSANF